MRDSITVDRAALDGFARGLLQRCAFPVGELTCAVSGGADSTALLLLAVASGADVTAVHVDHGIRVGSESDAEHIRLLAASLGVAVRLHRVEVSPGANLEARARDARYGVLPRDVCTGHTADDVAETVVLNMLRGAGLDGLAPMVRERGGPHRPLLALRRSETVQLCAALGLPVLHDSMNEDARFQRVRVRNEVIPLLDDVAKRDVAAIIVRQAQLLGDDADLLDELARPLDATEAASLCNAPASLARRAVRRWLVAAGVGDGHPVDAATVERVLDVARLQAVAADLVDGWRVARTGGRLRLEHSTSQLRAGGDADAASTLPHS